MIIYQSIVNMNIKKIILGLAQSNKDYGFDANKNISKVFKNLDILGVNSVDTSPTYKNSHEYVNTIKQKHKFKIYSKLPIIKSCDQNNIKLEVTRILDSIFYLNNIRSIEAIIIHDPILPLEGKKWDTVYSILKTYQKKGLIKKIGISIYNIFELQNILKIFKPDLIQFPLNVFHQEFCNQNLLQKLKKKNITLVARSVFLQGLLCIKNKKIDDYFQPWKKKFESWQNFLKVHKKKAEEACLDFVLNCKYVDKVVIGVNTEKQLKKNIDYIKKIKKNDNIKLYNKLAVIDSNLTDPRFWFRGGIKKNLLFLADLENYILNGGMLLSKKVSRYLPGTWPAFYKKAKKCFIWISGKKIIDFSLMGVGTNILGYANKQVNQKLIKTIKDSNMSTINSDLHLKLSKELLKLHPWGDKCFYARSGAEANSIALRIARSYTKKNEVVVCGYHGWQDWYLSANIKSSSNFGKMLLPGLSTIGIPTEIGNLIHTFKYNDLVSLKKIIKKNKNIGTIFMEVQRNQKPVNNFLKKIRDIATKNKIVLIFDECTSGFRETFGGLHLKYNVNPDIAVFGKALGNGVPINAIIGKKNIMDAGKESFISSTFWSDSLGPAAALATLEEMKKIKSWKKISYLGNKIKKKWKALSLKYGVKIKISGLSSMPMFVFESLKNDYYINFITQEMINKNYLATNTIYCCIDHSQYIGKYFKVMEKIFKKIKDFENGESISLYLSNPPSEKNFARLN